MREAQRPRWTRIVPALGHSGSGGRPLLDGVVISVAPGVIGRWVLRMLRRAAAAGMDVRPLAPGVAAQRIDPLALFAAAVYRTAPLSLHEYPVAAVNFIERAGLRGPSHRMVEQDVVGCYLDLRYGRQARVFIDDRYDMFPLAVADDYEDLIKGNPRSLTILDRLHVDVVLWDKDLALVGTVKATGRWQQVYSTGGWVVLRRAQPQ